MTAKEILNKVKAIFAEPVPPVAPIVAADPAPPAPIGVACPLADGRVMTCTPDMSPGAACTIDGAPTPVGEYPLADGSTVSVVQEGVIAEVKSASPMTQPAPVDLTAGNVQSMYAKFATGTPEERLANLETMVKALMECNFGYQIRQGQENQAIQIYKDTIEPTQAAVTQQASQLAVVEKKIEKQDKVIEGLFELAEKLAETPTADPVTLTGNKKDQFEKSAAKEKRIEKLAGAIAQLKNKN